MHVYLLPALALGPQAIARLARALPTEKLDAKTAEDRFSPREMVAHLADMEPRLREERIRAALETPGVTVPLIDEDGLAIENNYAHADLETSLTTYLAEREKTIVLIRTIPTAAESQTIIHPTVGPIALVDLINFLVGHDTYHLEHLTHFLTDGYPPSA